MSERAKEIAAKIIADVWPDFVCDGTRRALESAVEKHMMTPPASNPEPGSPQPGTPWDSPPTKQSKPPANNPEQAKPLTAKEHIEAAIDQLWGDYAEEVRGKSIDLRTNYARVIGTMMDVIDDMWTPE